SAIEPLAERLPFEELADQERRPFTVADVVDRQQVRMIEHPGGARFLLESLQAFLVAERDRRQDFDRDVAAETSVRCAVDRAHTSLADPSGDPVRPEHRVFLEMHDLW